VLTQHIGQSYAGAVRTCTLIPLLREKERGKLKGKIFPPAAATLYAPNIKGLMPRLLCYWEELKGKAWGGGKERRDEEQ
jgi:hypothetical protein